MSTAGKLGALLTDFKWSEMRRTKARKALSEAIQKELRRAQLPDKINVEINTESKNDFRSRQFVHCPPRHFA